MQEIKPPQQQNLHSNQLDDHGGAQPDATWRFARPSNTLAISWRMVLRTIMNMPV